MSKSSLFEIYSYYGINKVKISAKNILKQVNVCT